MQQEASCSKLYMPYPYMADPNPVWHGASTCKSLGRCFGRLAAACAAGEQWEWRGGAVGGTVQCRGRDTAPEVGASSSMRAQGRVSQHQLRRRVEGQEGGWGNADGHMALLRRASVMRCCWAGCCRYLHCSTRLLNGGAAALGPLGSLRGWGLPLAAPVGLPALC